MVEGVEQIRVEHARPSDSDQIAFSLSRACPWPRPVARTRVREHVGTACLLVAKAGEDLVGVRGSHFENPVARETAFLLAPVHFCTLDGGALLSTMEEMTSDVQSEAATLLAAPDAPPGLHAFWHSFGYEDHETAGLPSRWQEATRDSHPTGLDRLFGKRLSRNHLTRLFNCRIALRSRL